MFQMLPFLQNLLFNLFSFMIPDTSDRLCLCEELRYSNNTQRGKLCIIEIN